MRYLSEMTDRQTLVVYSGHPLGLFPSHPDAPRAIITNGMVIPNYSTRAQLDKMYATCVSQYGQMTAGSYCYIGPQGIVHGTTISILSAARKWLGGRIEGVVYVSSGLGGMSGAQPKAARIAGCIGVTAEVDADALYKRHRQGWVDEVIDKVPALLERLRELRASKESKSIGYLGNIVDLWEAFAKEEEMLVELGSDQTSLHNPFGGGYTPVSLTYEESKAMLVDDPALFKQHVQDSLKRQVTALHKLEQRGLRFWDYGNAFLVEATRAGANVLDEASSKAGLTPDNGGAFRWPSYIQAFMGDIFSLGFGPFRWVCTSGKEEDLQKTDEIAACVFRKLMQHANEKAKGQYADNLKWVEEAGKNKMVVGSQARILYSNCEGRAALAAAFNEAVKDGCVSAPIVASRDHHDVSGTDSPYRETSDVYDGSAFTADMAVQNALGDAARGATWVALHNGGGVGWGEVINGGFGLVLDGTADAGRRAESMLSWDVSNGLARRSWAGNANAQLTIREEMQRQDGLAVTLPVKADRSLVRNALSGDQGANGVAKAPGSELEYVLTNCRVATMSAAATVPYGLLDGAAVGVRADGRIGFVGSAGDVTSAVGFVPGVTKLHDLGGKLVTPGLIDCHTHIVYGGDRSEEWELKLQGASYEEVARAGGGIVNTVSGTRSSSVEAPAKAASPRIEQLMREGVTSLEIKSGYGLDVETERRQLLAAEAAASTHGFKLARTFLGAHAVPAEYKGRPDEYIDEVVLPAMDALHKEGHVDAVDAFCEGIGFTYEQTARVFKHAASLGLRCRLHGDQLSDGRCGELAAEYGALSCDHCEHMSAAGAKAMGEAGVVAVLLPASSVFINEAKLPPVADFRAEKVALAVATNCNPGSSPCPSLLLALHLACSRFRLTPEEAFAGVTRHAAAALGRQAQVGTLEVGKAADLAVWQCAHPRDIMYQMGYNPLVACFVDGKERPSSFPARSITADSDERLLSTLLRWTGSLAPKLHASLSAAFTTLLK